MNLINVLIPFRSIYINQIYKVLCLYEILTNKYIFTILYPEDSIDEYWKEFIKNKMYESVNRWLSSELCIQPKEELKQGLTRAIM